MTLTIHYATGGKVRLIQTPPLTPRQRGEMMDRRQEFWDFACKYNLGSVPAAVTDALLDYEEAPVDCLRRAMKILQADIQRRVEGDSVEVRPHDYGDTRLL